MGYDLLLFAFGAILLSGFGQFYQKHLLGEVDTMVYSFLVSLAVGAFMLPLVFIEPFQFPGGPVPLLLILASGFLWFANNLVSYRGIRATDLSLAAPLARSKVIFAAVFAAIFLGEAVSQNRVLGTLIVFIGVAILTWQRGTLAQLRDKGVQLVLLGALIEGFVAIFDKYNMGLGFSPAFYGVMMFLIPAIGHGASVAMFKRTQLVPELKKHGLKIGLIGAVYAILTYLVLVAYKMFDVSLVYPLMQLGLVFAMLLGVFFLRERGSLLQRFAGAAVMILGAVLVTV